MHLQPLMRKGNPAAIMAGMKVMAHQAEINGVKPPQELDVACHDLELERRQERELQERIVQAMTPAERRDYLRIIQAATQRLSPLVAQEQRPTDIPIEVPWRRLDGSFNVPDDGSKPSRSSDPTSETP